ncbi:MAG TPA: SufD family Fe-S cluster assembly protein, partial [Rhizomicrobium sp.]|nr:SufD family Fe-S cluster assembly protein [Rhizomicrobium sp.]
MNATTATRLTDALSLHATTSAAWLDSRRADAARLFRDKGVPHRRVENWKYTDLKTALDGANDAGASDIRCTIGGLPEGVELLDLSNLADAPQWVQAHFGRAALSDSMPAASLVLARAGFALRVPKNLRALQPLRIAVEGSGHARVLLVLEEGAALELVESRPEGTGFSNVGMEIVVGANARMTHVRVADASPEAIAVEDIAVRVARDGAYSVHLA